MRILRKKNGLTGPSYTTNYLVNWLSLDCRTRHHRWSPRERHQHCLVFLTLWRSKIVWSSLVYEFQGPCHRSLRGLTSTFLSCARVTLFLECEQYLFSCFLLSLASLDFLARVTILRDCSQSKKCAARQKEIGNHRFQKQATLSKLTSPCWTMRKVLITWWVSELHLDRYGWVITLHLMCFLFLVTCLCRHFSHVCKIWDNLSDLVN